MSQIRAMQKEIHGYKISLKYLPENELKTKVAEKMAETEKKLKERIDYMQDLKIAQDIKKDT